MAGFGLSKVTAPGPRNLENDTVTGARDSLGGALVPLVNFKSSVSHTVRGNGVASVAHVGDTPIRHGTPDAALRVAHKSTAEIIGEIPEGDIDQALIPSIEEVPPGGEGGGDSAGGADGGSKLN